MSAAIAQRYFRCLEESDESKGGQTTEKRHIQVAPISVLDAGDIGDAAVMAIASAWARHSTAANGFGD